MLRFLHPYTVILSKTLGIPVHDLDNLYKSYNMKRLFKLKSEIQDLKKSLHRPHA